MAGDEALTLVAVGDAIALGMALVQLIVYGVVELPPEDEDLEPW